MFLVSFSSRKSSFLVVLKIFTALDIVKFEFLLFLHVSDCSRLALSSLLNLRKSLCSVN